MFVLEAGATGCKSILISSCKSPPFILCFLLKCTFGAIKVSREVNQGRMLEEGKKKQKKTKELFYGLGSAQFFMFYCLTILNGFRHS